MKYETRYKYLLRAVKAGVKVYYKNSSGFLYEENDKLYAEWCDDKRILIDEWNIKYASIEMFFGGNLHIYRIEDDKYKLIKVYTKWFRNDSEINKRIEQSKVKFGEDIIAMQLATQKDVSLDGLPYTG